MIDAIVTESRRLEYLGVLGVTVYRDRRTVLAEAPAAPRAVTTGAPDWDALCEAVAGCTRCGLSATRTQTVFGTGDRGARLMVIGEAPGFEEDRQGKPFVGRAGQLLNSMLKAAGFDRREVFIANVLKCRPPNNRNPQPDEAAACLSYLSRQIELVAPRVILCVGRIAAQNLLATAAPLGTLRGAVHRHDSGVPVVVTYHPAYLLRSPGEKRKAWEDLKFVVRLLRDGDRS